MVMLIYLCLYKENIKRDNIIANNSKINLLRDACSYLVISEKSQFCINKLTI